MGRMNIHLDDKRDEKLKRLKDKFNIQSKEETIMRLIDQFPEEDKKNDFIDVEKELSIGDLL